MDLRNYNIWGKVTSVEELESSSVQWDTDLSQLDGE